MSADKRRIDPAQLARRTVKCVLYAYLCIAVLLLLSALLLSIGLLSPESERALVLGSTAIGTFLSAALTQRRQENAMLVQAGCALGAFTATLLLIRLLVPALRAAEGTVWPATAAAAAGCVGGVLIHFNKKHNITKKKRRKYYK